jgi:putative ABC transport system permease protein
MNPSDLARGAVLEIRAHPARSALTALSLSIGVAAMLFTFATAGGAAREYRAAVALAGADRLDIRPRPGYVSKGRSPGLTWDDAREIRRLWPRFPMVYPRDSRWGVRMRWREFSNKNITVFGTTEEWRRRDWVYRLRGRFIDARDVALGARVCVLVAPGGADGEAPAAGSAAKMSYADLLRRRDLLGQSVRLDDHVFTVIGVLQEPPPEKDMRWFAPNRGDGLILTPISALQDNLPTSARAIGQVETIDVDTGDDRAAALDRRRIAALLLARHRGEPDVEIFDFRELVAGALRQLRKTVDAIMLIGIVALLASGIGIMNVTLATALSRVREIGIKRALGASRRDILLQFVSEALVLGAAGGAAGVLLGLLAIVRLSPDPDRVLMPAPLHYAGAAAVALGTALLFALLPAYRASRYDPVEALRYE